MKDIEKFVDITQKMGLKKLPRKAWAKTEILVGSLSEAIGGLYAVYNVVNMTKGNEFNLVETGAGVLLFVLGKYLYSAGNRSMIYRSLNLQTNYLESILQGKK